MLKKSITYTDFNDEKVTEDFFFHLSKAELIELEMSHKEGLSVALRRIVDSNDGKAIIEEFKKIILMAYGKKSEDGKRFIKNQALRDEFESSEAYSELFIELVTNATAAAEFVNALVPTAMVEALRDDLAKAESPPFPTSKPEPQMMTRQEIEKLSPEEFAELPGKLDRGEVVIVANN